MLWNVPYKNDETFCNSCKKNTAKVISCVRRTKQKMLVSNCAVCREKNRGS